MDATTGQYFCKYLSIYLFTGIGATARAAGAHFATGAAIA